MKKSQGTVVIFRQLKGEVIALFPELEANFDGAHCKSYIHFGQHGSANYNYVIAHSRPATKRAAAPLLRELQKVGYKDLRVMQRATRAAHQARQEVLSAQLDFAHGF